MSDQARYNLLFISSLLLGILFGYIRYETAGSQPQKKRPNV